MQTHHSLRLRQQLGRQIRLQRLGRGWSQDTLAALSGLHRSYIGGVERGERNITIDNIEKIAAALNVHAAQLLGDNGQPFHRPAHDATQLREPRVPYRLTCFTLSTKRPLPGTVPHTRFPLAA